MPGARPGAESTGSRGTRALRQWPWTNWQWLCAALLSAWIAGASTAVPGADTGCAAGGWLNATCFKTPGYNLVHAADPGACCALCAADVPRCKAWTFLSDAVGVDGKSTNCHLKNAAADREACGNGVSGSTVPPPPPPPPAPPGALNVVFLVIDDLRPNLNQSYGQGQMVTPRLDAFAKTAMTFTRAYVQYSHCSPSRNSFMSGRSPQTTGVYNFIDHFREPGVGANWTALPQFFKEHGYYVAGGGKVYHPGHPPNNDMPQSWDDYFFKNGDDSGCRSNETIFSNVCPSAEPLSAFYDWNLVNETRGVMAAAAKLGKPFFVAAGLRRPHRVWHVPRQFYDLYPNNGTAPLNMQLAKHRYGPKGMPELAYIDNAWPPEPYNQTNPPPDAQQALGRWGYYSAVSFTDYNVGLVLDALTALGVENNTVVVLTGDHGWTLGEHAEFCKRVNFELGVRVPYVIRSPRHPKTYGVSTDSFAESLDFYRTLVGLALPMLPTSAIEAGVEGDSLVPVFDSAGAPVKNSTFSQMARCPAKGTLGPESACNTVKLVDIPYMGYSIRTDAWRYTVWIAFNGTRNRALWAAMPTSIRGEELYDHAGDDGSDFDAFENVNVVTNPANAQVRAALLARVRSRFDTPPTAAPALS